VEYVLDAREMSGLRASVAVDVMLALWAMVAARRVVRSEPASRQAARVSVSGGCAVK